MHSREVFRATVSFTWIRSRNECFASSDVRRRYKIRKDWNIGAAIFVRHTGVQTYHRQQKTRAFRPQRRHVRWAMAAQSQPAAKLKNTPNIRGHATAPSVCARLLGSQNWWSSRINGGSVHNNGHKNARALTEPRRATGWVSRPGKYLLNWTLFTELWGCKGGAGGSWNFCTSNVCLSAGICLPISRNYFCYTFRLPISRFLSAAYQQPLHFWNTYHQPIIRFYHQPLHFSFAYQQVSIISLSSAVTLFVCLSAGFYHQPISSRYTFRLPISRFLSSAYQQPLHLSLALFPTPAALSGCTDC